MSVETRSLSRALLLAAVRAKPDVLFSVLPVGREELSKACWHLAARWDADGAALEAIEEKSFTPPHPQKADGK